jgi:nitrogen regulatory protein PII
MAKQAAKATKETAFTPYEENHHLVPLGFTITVVPRGQANAIGDRLKKCGSACWFITHGEGTAPSDVAQALGVSDSSKHIVFGFLKQDMWPDYKAALLERFKVSPFARGIAYYIDLTALCGVSVYKMLANIQVVDKPIKKKRKEAPKNMPENKKYEAILVIVNNGFTDLVMNAARAAGARGGTIISARGTGNKEIEKFFGVVITPEKEIVMILVKSEIRDAVLAAVNKEAGIDSKGQGIAFSIPVSDVAGLRGEEAAPIEK